MKNLIVATLAVTGTLLAQEPAPATAPPKPAEAPAPASTEPPKPPKRSLLKYTPPKDTASGQRIDGDGGSRSGGEFKYPRALFTMIPKTGAAITTRAMPSLFAFMSDDVTVKYQVTIKLPKKAQPVFLFAVEPKRAGIHRINLAEYGVVLEPGVEYEWDVIVRPDNVNRSADLRAGGTVKRVVPDAALLEKLKTTPAIDHAAVYAEAGIWYDALAVLSDQIAADPADAELRAMRPALLSQVGLEIPALADQLAGDPDNKGIKGQLDKLIEEFSKKAPR